MRKGEIQVYLSRESDPGLRLLLAVVARAKLDAVNHRAPRVQEEAQRWLEEVRSELGELNRAYRRGERCVRR